jgi:hypothetical protein
MEFKELLKLDLSARKSKFWGHWKSKEKYYSEITISMASSIQKELCILPEHFILETFLTEYLCSCIFRGNRLKKECWNKKKDAKKICIPEIVSNSILKLLDD